VSPRVSVIVAAYNAAGHLPGALESVLAQTYNDWEVVVADDGSTDETSAVAARFGPRVRVVRSEVNRGLAAARNLALAHARGELVAILDSDDAWLPDFLAEQVPLVTGDVGIACCDAWLATPEGRTGERYGDRFGRPDGEVTLATLLRSNPIFVCAVAPRAVVEAAGGFDERLRSVEDLDLWLRIVARGHRVAYNARPLAVYTIAPGQLSRDTIRMTRSRQQVLRKLLATGALTPPERRLAWRALAVQRTAELAARAARRLGRGPA